MIGFIREDYLLAFLDFETTGVHKEALPIEIGIVLTDHTFRELSRFQTLIRWHDFAEYIEDAWPEQCQGAFEVHGIPLSEVRSRGSSPRVVIQALTEWLEPYKKRYDKVVVPVSDNVLYEHRMLKTLFEWNRLQPRQAIGGLFHYRMFDVSLVCEMHGVPVSSKSGAKGHRALDDAMVMLRAVRKISKSLSQ